MKQVYLQDRAGHWIGTMDPGTCQDWGFSRGWPTSNYENWYMPILIFSRGQLTSNWIPGLRNGSLLLLEDRFKMLYGGKRLGIDTYLFITESYFVLWPLPRFCLRDQQWELCPLELYWSENMVRLGRFASSLPPSGFLTFPPFRSPFLGTPRDPAITMPPLP